MSFIMNTPLKSLGFISFSILLSSATGCKLVDKLTDALEGGGPSYCESLCDWAVTCVEEEGNSDIGKDEMMSRCLDNTRESDGACADAESKSLSVDDNLILNECTGQVADMSCNGLVGDESQVRGGHPPVLTCMVAYGGGAEELVGIVADLPESTVELVDVKPYKTYNAARNAVLENGSEVCERFEDTLCGNVVECMVDKAAEIGGAEVTDEQQTTAVDACLDYVMDGLTSECIATERYDSTLPLDINVGRYSAMECMDEWDETAAADGACEIFTSVPSAWCLGAFSDAEDAAQMFELVVTFMVDFAF
jgi:hypothetical protein